MLENNVWFTHQASSITVSPPATHCNDIIDHPRRNVHASRIDTVAKLHSVVDLVDQQPAVSILEYIDRHDAAADRLRRADADIRQRRCDRAVTGRAATSSVGNPVLA